MPCHVNRSSSDSFLLQRHCSPRLHSRGPRQDRRDPRTSMALSTLRPLVPPANKPARALPPKPLDPYTCIAEDRAFHPFISSSRHRPADPLSNFVPTTTSPSPPLTYNAVATAVGAKDRRPHTMRQRHPYSVPTNNNIVTQSSYLSKQWRRTPTGMLAAPVYELATTTLSTAAAGEMRTGRARGQDIIGDAHDTLSTTVALIVGSTPLTTGHCARGIHVRRARADTAEQRIAL